MDKTKVEPTIFFIEKILFSLKLFSGHFYGQSFIKTVRGPLHYSSASTLAFCAYRIVEKSVATVSWCKCSDSIETKPSLSYVKYECRCRFRPKWT